MTDLKLVTLVGNEWLELYEKWPKARVHSELGPAIDFRDDCTELKFPNHSVVRGISSQENRERTNLGFLKNEQGEIVKIVTGIVEQGWIFETADLNRF